MCVHHFVVVEPQEYDTYVENLQNEYCTILKLDMTYKDNYDVFSCIGGEVPDQEQHVTLFGMIVLKEVIHGIG